MRLRSTLIFGFLLTLSLLGTATAGTPVLAPAHDHTAAPVQASPVPPALIAITWLQPPPPPPGCPTICRTRYQWCIGSGAPPSACHGKYLYCLTNCSDPPILTD